MRPLPLVIACLLGVLAALATSCGGDRSKLIPATDAQSLLSQLDAVRAAVEQGTVGCGEADAAANSARSTVRNLDEEVDARLRSRLLTGIKRLKDRAAYECANQTGTTTQVVPTTTTTLPETQPATTATQAPTTTAAPPVTPTATQVTPTATQENPDAPPDSGGLSPDDSSGTGGADG